MTEYTDTLLAAGWGKHTLADMAGTGGIGPFVSVPTTALAAELVRSDEDEQSATIQAPSDTVPAFGERVSWDTLRSLITINEEGYEPYVSWRQEEHLVAALDHEQAKATAYSNTLSKVRAFLTDPDRTWMYVSKSAVLDILERCEQDF